MGNDIDIETLRETFGESCRCFCMSQPTISYGGRLAHLGLEPVKRVT